MTIDELKRALVEVQAICEKTEECIDCQLHTEEFIGYRGKRFGCCPLQVQVDYEPGFPENWAIDDWKEDSNG
jgi:hypothetical protein